MSAQIVKSDDNYYGIVTLKGIHWLDDEQHNVKTELNDMSMAGVAYIHACCHFPYAARCVYEYLRTNHLEIPEIECDTDTKFSITSEIEAPTDARIAETTKKQEFSSPHIPGLRAYATVKDGYIETTPENIENAQLCATLRPMPIRVGASVVPFDKSRGDEYTKTFVLPHLKGEKMMWEEVHCPTDDIIKGLLIYNGSTPKEGDPIKKTIGDWFYYVWPSTTRYKAVLYSV